MNAAPNNRFLLTVRLSSCRRTGAQADGLRVNRSVSLVGLILSSHSDDKDAVFPRRGEEIDLQIMEADAVSNLGSFQTPAPPPISLICHHLPSQSCGTRVPPLTARYAISCIEAGTDKTGWCRITHVDLFETMPRPSCRPGRARADRANRRQRATVFGLTCFSIQCDHASTTLTKSPEASP